MAFNLMQPHTMNSDARSKGARSARKAQVGEFNLHVSEDCDQSVCCSLWTRRALASIPLAASVVDMLGCVKTNWVSEARTARKSRFDA